MKPNFALSLSFEGIRLLHRAAGGWRVVGDVALDAVDMAAELAVLRRTATALDPSGLRTKVLLPNAQIKYLTIDSDGLDAEAQRDAARAALDGTTPYAVDDLVFDVSNDGTRTHIAAVARETLAEAEGFAQEHRLNPISFAAVPGDNSYLGEPFFGPAPMALAALSDGDTIEADGIAVVIIGNAGSTDGPVVDVPADAPENDTAAQDETPAATDADASSDEVETPDVSEDAAAPEEQLDIFDDAAAAGFEDVEGTQDSQTQDGQAEDTPAEEPAAEPVKSPEPAPFITSDVIEDEAPDPVQNTADGGVEVSDEPSDVLPENDTPEDDAPKGDAPEQNASHVSVADDVTAEPAESDEAQTNDQPVEDAPAVDVKADDTAPSDVSSSDDALLDETQPDETQPDAPQTDKIQQDTQPNTAVTQAPALDAPADEGPVKYKPTVKAPAETDAVSTDAPDENDAHEAQAAETPQPDLAAQTEPVTKPEGDATPVAAEKADPETPEPAPATVPPAPKVALTIDLPKAAPSAGFASRRADTKPADSGRVEPAVARPVPAAPPEIFRAPDRLVADTATETAQRSGPSKAVAGMAAAAAAAAPIGRFLSRRKSAAQPVSAAAAPASVAAAPQTEAERMTVFGARQSNVGGKPRFLGLILTAALLVFLAGVAAWASVFLDDGLNLSRLFGDRTTREASNTTTAPEQSQTPTENVITASLDPTLTPEDTAVLDALRDPVVPQVEELSQRELEKIYATTGIWPRAPSVPPEPSGLVNIDDLYLTSIDPVSSATDAVALPSVASFGTDLPLGTAASPAAAGTKFALDARGLVIPTASGAVTPNGFTVYLGRPPVQPPVSLARFAAVPQDDTARTALAALRPKDRPDDLAETNERATLNGQTRSELAAERPKLRPRSIQQLAQDAANKARAEAQAAEDAKKAAEANINTDAAVENALATQQAPNTFASATRFATKASARPDTRPRNFARIVRRAQRTEQPKAQEETRVASRQVAPRVVTPRNPTKKSVARQATVKNAINLRKVNLIGVYGKPSSRRALVRLGNGRYKKVTVGDRIDGGRVSAISNSELRYSKGGRNVVLKMP